MRISSVSREVEEAVDAALEAGNVRKDGRVVTCWWLSVISLIDLLQKYPHLCRDYSELKAFWLTVAHDARRVYISQDDLDEICRVSCAFEGTPPVVDELFETDIGTGTLVNLGYWHKRSIDRFMMLTLER